jgi:hypothetical protein
MITLAKMVKVITPLLLLVGLLLSACTSSLAGVTSTQSPTNQLTPTPVPTPTETLSQEPKPAQLALKDLAAALNLNSSDISINSVEKTTWQDACLGVKIPGQVCAQQLIPGYKILLGANGESYEYHTNQDGSIRIVVPGLSIQWVSNGQCLSATIRQDEGIDFGACGGTTTKVPFADSSQSQDLAFFTGKFAPFYADTSAGIVNFVGVGAQISKSPDQRMIGEWARLVVSQAAGGSTNSTYGVVIDWHQEGGSAGVCEDLTVYINGQVQASSCQGSKPQDLGHKFLNTDQLDEFYNWVDTLKPFETSQDHQAQATPLVSMLIFEGTGTEQATQSDMQKIDSFSAQIYDGFSSK